MVINGADYYSQNFLILRVAHRSYISNSMYKMYWRLLKTRYIYFIGNYQAYFI